MVCAQNQSTKIRGGFFTIPVPALITAWRACNSTNLNRTDFRTWLATQEMLARRCLSETTRTPNYTIAELAKLLGGLSRRRVQASVRRLATAGILIFGPDRIEFPQSTEIQSPIDAIGAGKGMIVIPRRLLRYLVADASPALIATALAVLLRCLSRRKTGFQGRGRLKASWVAELFAIDLRRVKAARSELLRLKWIEPELSNQSAENRWGRAYRIDLTWDRPQGAVLPPHPTVLRRGFATPSINLDPLREEIQHQEPALPTGTGFRIETAGGKEGEATNLSVTRQSTSSPSVHDPITLPAPRLNDIRPEDLGSVERLLELHGQAIDRGLIGGSEADQLKFLALAEHSRSVGKSNPPGLFAALLGRGAWSYITQSEEDQARKRLKAHFWAPVSPLVFEGISKMKERRQASEDSRIAREICRSLLAAGYRGDPFPQMRRLDPSWTRARWDLALRGD